MRPSARIDAFAEQRIVGRHFLHLGDHGLAVGGAFQRGDRFEVMHDRRIDAGLAPWSGIFPEARPASAWSRRDWRRSCPNTRSRSERVLAPSSSPSDSTSLMKTSRPAKCWPPAVMPNSAPCLIELSVSPPALASPMIFAFESCACSRKEEKSLVVERRADAAQHLAAIGLHHGRRVAFERMAEGIVGGEEEPGVAAGLHQRLPVPLASIQVS